MIAIPNISKPKEAVNAEVIFRDSEGYVVGHVFDMPIIEIASCGECKYWHEGRCWNMKGLNKTDGVVNSDDFCSYGKKGGKNR